MSPERVSRQPASDSLSSAVTNRRAFLGASLGSALSAGVLATGGSSALAQDDKLPKVSSVEASAAASARRFKLSVAAYGYRSLLDVKNPKLTIAEFFDDCVAMGVEGVEPTSYYFPEDVTADQLRLTKREAFRRGLDISGTAIGCDFAHPAGDARDKELKHVKRWVELADAMDAPHIRIFSGAVKKDQDPEEAYQLAADGIREVCEYAGQYGVTLGLENHGGLSTTADGLLRFCNDIQSPWFGINLDTGNFHGRDVYGDLAKLAPYAVNVQFKVSIKPEGEPKQPGDMARIAEILRSANYRGYVVLEFEESGDPRVECPKLIAKMREVF